MPCRQRPAGGFVAVVTKQIEAGRALADIYPARFCTLCRKEDAMSKQRIQLSDHFTYPRLLRFVLPCIGTMLFTSIYGIVDGLCVSNFVGKTAFAAVNLIMPLPMLLGTIGFMLGIDGIWLAVTAAELAALAVSAAMLLTKDKVFHYRKA